MRSLTELSKVVSGVFVTIIVVSALAALLDLSLLQFVRGIASGGPVDEARASLIDSIQALMGVIQVLLYLVCAIVFLLWLYRAYKNLGAAGLHDLRFSPGWAVGGFFVPFLNLVRPYQVMTELWWSSELLSRKSKLESSGDVVSSSHVGWWWTLFLTSSALGNVSGRLTLHAQEIGEILTAIWVTLASDLLDIPTALLCLYLVRRITDLQEVVQQSNGNSELTVGA